MTFRTVNPESLGAPKGFSHGVLASGRGRLLFVAGQPGWDASAGAASAAPEFAEQFALALDRVLAVVRTAGGSANDVARLTVYVVDLEAYRAARPKLADAWRQRFGTYYPAMALLEVKGLVDAGALVEIEATAVLEGESSHAD
ncbi:MAG: RidA family protein [Candidatus Eiseniibacteriota bacterium]